MTPFTNVPKQVEELLDESSVTPSRRTFLKSSGLFVVSFSAAAASIFLVASRHRMAAQPSGGMTL